MWFWFWFSFSLNCFRCFSSSALPCKLESAGLIFLRKSPAGISIGTVSIDHFGENGDHYYVGYSSMWTQRVYPFTWNKQITDLLRNCEHSNSVHVLLESHLFKEFLKIDFLVFNINNII